MEYMINCYTSLTGVKANVKKLLQVQDATTKLKTNQETIANTTSRRVKRQKNTESVTCATYIVQVTTFETVSKRIIYLHDDLMCPMLRF